jgi:hypothetical protein
LQDATSKSIGRLKRGQGPVVTPGLPGVWSNFQKRGFRPSFLLSCDWFFN